MKKFLFSLLALVCFNMMSAQGVKFLYSFEEAMVQAQKENKLIFMDAYTTWCGPCKMLNKRTFPKSEVGNFYNKNFINVKVDMEKGEGPALAEKYAVRAYPTLLFIDRFGKAIHQAAGFRGPEALINLGKTALDPSKQIGALTKRFENGDRDPEFLLNYAEAAYEANKGGHQKIAEAYIATQSDRSTETNLKFIFRMLESVDSPLFEYLTSNQDKFAAYFPEAQIKGKIENTIYASIYELGPNPDLAEVDKIFKKAYPQNAAQMSARYRLRHYMEAGDLKKFEQTAISYVKKHKINDWEELNELAWNVYENSMDRKVLKKACKWTKKSIKLNKNFYNSDTLASLYYKLGKKKKARKAAESAIALAKAEGEDYSSTTNLLKEIEKL